MSDLDKTNSTLCDDCKGLIGASRHTRPHANLSHVEFKAVGSMFGSVDETYYKCRVCGKEWLHETGSYGQGWVE